MEQPHKKIRVYCKEHIPYEVKNLQKQRNKIALEQISCFSELLKENWKDSKNHNSEYMFLKESLTDQQNEESEQRAQENSTSANFGQENIGGDEKSTKIKKNIITQVRNLLYKVSNINIFVSKRFTFEKHGDRSKQSAEMDLREASEGKQVGMKLIRKREYIFSENNNVDLDISYEITLDKVNFPWDLVSIDGLSKEEIIEIYQKTIPNKKSFERYIVGNNPTSKRKKKDWEKNDHQAKKNKIRVEELKKSIQKRPQTNSENQDNTLWCYCRKTYDDEVDKMISNFPFLFFFHLTILFF